MDEQPIKVYKPRILKAMLSGIFFCLFLLIYVLVMIAAFGIWPLLAWIFVSAITLGTIYLYITVQSYEIKQDGLHIKTGIIAKSRGTLLYSQIQDVQEYQDLFARIIGVTSLEIKTMAQTSGKLINLSNADAKELKEFILSKAAKQKTKTTKIAQKVAKQVIGEQEKVMPYPIYPFRKALLTVGLLSFILLILIPFLFKESIVIIFSSIIIPLLILIIWLPIGAAITKIALKYYLANDYLEKRYDFITKSNIHIPYLKIQDLVIKQGIVDRILKLASIKVETGEKQDKYQSQEEQQRQMFLNVIPSLKRDEAFSLQNQILKLMGIKNTQTTELRSQYPLNAIKPLKKSLRATWTLFVLLMILTLFGLPLVPLLDFEARGFIYSIDFTITNIIILTTFFLIKIIYESIYFKTYYYSDNNVLLVLRKGVLFLDTLTIPYNKIQHIFVDQDIFDRLFGLWDVHVASAGTTGMQLHIDGLKKQHAETLRDLLINRTRKK